MRWAIEHHATPLPIHLPDGYHLRCFVDNDAPAYQQLMAQAGFSGWTPEKIAETQCAILPDGFFVIEHLPTHTLVATAMASHRAIEGYPYGGELGWVAADANHAGKGLGLAICSAVINRFLQSGYKNIFLLTDDFRKPALKIYLKMGFVPDLYKPGMEKRWEAIYKEFGWKE